MSYTAISLAIEEHRSALIRLWQENFYDPQQNDFAHERFAWLYQQSPDDATHTWVAIEIETEAVIGAGSVIRANQCIGARLVRTGVCVVFMVEEKHRMAAAALAIQRAVIRASRQMGFELLIAKPNDKARPIVTRVGYQPIGELQDWVKFVGIDVGLVDYPNALSYSDEIVSAADERFDQLWETGKLRCGIVGHKTAAFLNWRYSGFKENYRFYCLLRQTDRQLVGYLVFYVMKKGVVVAELFCQEPSGPILQNLLLGFASRMRTAGHEWVTLSYLGAPSFENTLRCLGFVHAKHRQPLVAYMDPTLSLDVRNQILQKDNWFIFAGEMEILLSRAVWPDRPYESCAASVEL